MFFREQKGKKKGKGKGRKPSTWVLKMGEVVAGLHFVLEQRGGRM